MKRSIILLSLLSMSCAYGRLAQRDVIEVSKAPARHWRGATAAAVLVGAALVVDDEIADAVQRNDSHAMDSVTEAVEPFGGGHADKVIAGFLLYGVAAKNQRATNIAFDAFVSSILASKVITPALKEITDRERPNGGTADAFPSNHATNAFAVASAIAVHYDDKPWVKWAAYGLASGVGLSRIYREGHWTSDVIAGAAIGTLVGHTVAKTNRDERAKWTVAPVVTSDGVAITVRWTSAR